LSACYRPGKSPFHLCMTPGFFQRNVLSSHERIAHVRSPLELRLCDYPFQLKLSFPSLKSAMITVSNSPNPRAHPFTILNSRMCTDIRKMIQDIEETHREVSTITLAGVGRSFLVAPQLSFLSKLCVGQATLSVEERWGKDETRREPTVEERRDDYTSLFHSFIQLHACLAYENAESYVSSIIECQTSLLSRAPRSGEGAHEYREYIDAYTQQLLAPVSAGQYFSKSILLVGTNGMSFGLGTTLARTGDIRYGTPFSAWECPYEARKWVSVPQSKKFRTEQTNRQTSIERKWKNQLSVPYWKEVCRSLSRRAVYLDLEPKPNPPQPDKDTTGNSSILSANTLKECGELFEIFPLSKFQQELSGRTKQIASLGHHKVQTLKRLLRTYQ